MRNTVMAVLAGGLLALASMYVWAQGTANFLDPVNQFSITGYPYYGALVSPNDSADLSRAGFVRADSAGQVTAECYGNGDAGGDGDEITLNLAAGEFFPCMVVRVFDTNTDSITLHVFY